LNPRDVETRQKGLAYDDNLTLSVHTGARHVSIVDNVTHQMTVTSDGKVVHTMPGSLGSGDYPTYRGTNWVCPYSTAGGGGHRSPGLPRHAKTRSSSDAPPTRHAIPAARSAYARIMPASRSRRARAAQRRKRRLNRVEHDLTEEQWTALKAAWVGCAYCGAVDVPLQRDCVLAISRGGRYTLDNIVPACRSCNASKCNHEVTAWLRRRRFDERGFLARTAGIKADLQRQFAANASATAEPAVTADHPTSTRSC
jgi:5-methylcytosine-specific restriction endonuclease McrA